MCGLVRMAVRKKLHTVVTKMHASMLVAMNSRAQAGSALTKAAAISNNRVGSCSNVCVNHITSFKVLKSIALMPKATLDLDCVST